MLPLTVLDTCILTPLADKPPPLPTDKDVETDKPWAYLYLPGFMLCRKISVIYTDPSAPSLKGLITYHYNSRTIV